ncbi:MAG: hypothetical protein ABSD74_06045 [Rhizomicrobium sp.]|jgi:hypothetical protein
MAGPERAQPLLLHPQTAEKPLDNVEPRPVEALPTNIWPMVIAGFLCAFWIGASGAYAWGYFGPGGMFKLNLQELAILAFATFMPPMLMIIGAWAFTRGQAMASAAVTLAAATDRFFAVDETASRRVARLGRTVRHELDALNVGMDGAFARLRALETVLENQIAALDEAGARADVRAETASSRLGEERERMDQVANLLIDSASRASETIAGRAAQLKAMVESAEGSLKTIGQSLESQAASFQAAASVAAEAPQTVALELDKQAKRIESVSDAAMARAEFVLGRHERHRAAMSDLLQNLRDESTKLETALESQQNSMRAAMEELSAQAEKFEGLASNADRDLELIMVNATTRAAQLSQGFMREVDTLRDTSEQATATLSKIIDSLREAGISAQTLITESTSEARNSTKTLIGEAMAECEKLLRAAGELANQAVTVKDSMTQSAEDIQHHVLSLPGVAKQEAQRVRDVVRAETDEILDLSARTLSTIHARANIRPPVEEPAVAAGETENPSLLSLARRLTQRQKRKEPVKEAADDREKSWDMRALLTAVDSGDAKARDLKPDAAASLGALQVVLADIAIDLNEITLDAAPAEEEWRRYIAGDRSIFARKIAESIDADSVDRITALYRENPRFKDAANAYLSEFELLLNRAKDSDAGGLLSTTVLSADTGKIYLAVAYSLGRLSA